MSRQYIIFLKHSGSDPITGRPVLILMQRSDKNNKHRLSENHRGCLNCPSESVSRRMYPRFKEELIWLWFLMPEGR